MTIGLRLAALAALSLLIAGCSSGRNSDSTVILLGVVQDLDVDPSGRTTVVQFSSKPPSFGLSNWKSSGGQLALSTNTAGSEISVSWSERVTPSHSVSVLDVAEIGSAAKSVATSDESTPNLTATADLFAGLGGDQIHVAFSGGPNLLSAAVTNPANWSLRVNGTTLPWSNSSFSFDETTQTLTIVTDSSVNVHTNFSLTAANQMTVADVTVPNIILAGTGCCDVAAPNLVQAEQNLVLGPLGNVVEFEFDDAIDPISIQITDFQHPTALATAVQQVSAGVIRVTFSETIIPGKAGFDEVTVNSLLDVHGNGLSGAPVVQSVINTSPVAANFNEAATQATTVANVLGDTIVIATTQALDPEMAVDPDSWTIEVAGMDLDLEDHELSYDFDSATLTVALSLDLTNGDDVDITGDDILEIDGELFAANLTVVVSGDEIAPTLLRATQKQLLDPSGKLLNVSFSEDIDRDSAQDTDNWSFGPGGPDVLSAQLLTGFDVVRLRLDEPAIPGIHALSVSNLLDLAGNTAADMNAVSLGSDDKVAATLVSAEAEGVEGASNDVVTLVLDDQMHEPSVVDPLNWTLQSPVGNDLDVSEGSIAYDPSTGVVQLTFDGEDSVDFKRGQDFSVELQGATDIGGNISAPLQAIGVVDAESNLPAVQSVFFADGANRVHVVFTEPCEDLALANPGTRYSIFDVSTPETFKAQPVFATISADRREIELLFPFVVDPLNDQLRVFGVSDLAGNPLFPAAHVIAVEDTDAVALDNSTEFLTASGENNDRLEVRFSTSPNPQQVIDPTKYTFVPGGIALDLTEGLGFNLNEADFAWNATDEVLTILLNQATGLSLKNDDVWGLAINGLSSAQGVPGAFSFSNDMVIGDSTPPTLVPSRARVDAANPDNSVLFEINEAVDEDIFGLGLAPSFDVELEGASALSVELLGPRTMRANFAGTPGVGDILSVSIPDAAGNSMAMADQVVSPAPSLGPVLNSVAGVINSGQGGDFIEVQFVDPIETLGLSPALNFSVESPLGQTVSLTGSSMSYESASNTVRLYLSESIDLVQDASLRVQVSEIRNHDGLTTLSTSLDGFADGDLEAAELTLAHLNVQEDVGMTIVDVLFSEDLFASSALQTGLWSGSAGQGCLLVEQINAASFRLHFDDSMQGSDLQFEGGLTDTSGNVSGAGSVTPY